MPLTVHLGDKPGFAVYQEFDGPNGSGDKVAPVGTVIYASSDVNVATIDAASGVLTYVGVGKTNISGSDDGNFPASDVLEIVTNPIVSSTLTLNPGA